MVIVYSSPEAGGCSRISGKDESTSGQVTLSFLFSWGLAYSRISPHNCPPQTLSLDYFKISIKIYSENRNAVRMVMGGESFEKRVSLNAGTRMKKVFIVAQDEEGRDGAWASSRPPRALLQVSCATNKESIISKGERISPRSPKELGPVYAPTSRYHPRRERVAQFGSQRRWY